MLRKCVCRDSLRSSLGTAACRGQAKEADPARGNGKKQPLRQGQKKENVVPWNRGTYFRTDCVLTWAERC